MTKYQTIVLRFTERFFNHLYRSFASKVFSFKTVILMQITRILSEAHVVMVKSDNLSLNIKF